MYQAIIINRKSTEKYQTTLGSYLRSCDFLLKITLVCLKKRKLFCVNHSTAELCTQQLASNVFYLQMVLDLIKMFAQYCPLPLPLNQIRAATRKQVCTDCKFNFFNLCFLS